MNKLRNDLNFGIKADLQLDLLSRVINEDLFWTSLTHEQCIAKNMGFQAPVHSCHKLGQSAPFFVSDDAEWVTTLSNMESAITVYKSHVESILIQQSESEAFKQYDTVCKSYHERFLDEHKDNWLDKVKSELTIENHEQYPLGTDIEHAWDYEIAWLKATFDELADMLIMFAVQHAITSQRHLLRTVFIKRQCAFMLIKLTHYETVCKIVKEDVFSQVKPIQKKSATLQLQIEEEKVDTTTFTSTSSSKPLQIYCPHDVTGCTRLKCKYRHVASLQIPCMRLSCPGRDAGCNLFHKRPVPIDDPEVTPKAAKKQRTTPFKNKVCNETVLVQLCSSNPSSNPSFNIGSKEVEPQEKVHLKKTRRRRNHRSNPSSTTISLLHKLCKGITNTGVHVLNNCIVSEEENLILSLGLNFVPPPLTNKSIILKEAVDRFTRAVRIKKHFATTLVSQSPVTVETLLHTRINKSLSLRDAQAAFAPEITRSPIENYLTSINNTLLSGGIKHKTFIPNTAVWIAYYKIVKQLGSRQDIIIKPSDKNLGVSVMDRAWYIAEANKQLTNTSVYTKTENQPNVDLIIKGLQSIINTQDWLPQQTAKKLFKDLTVDNTLNRVKLCRIYFLPKLHKAPVGLRPICASQGWITYWTSVYIHLTVFPLLQTIPTYITNSRQLVTRLDKLNLPRHFQFIEADADNLYPSINIEDGLKALKYFLKHRIHMHDAQIRLLILLTRWVLTNNYVTLGDDIYLQISGTAMGTPCAVIFACIYLHVIEQEALDILKSTTYICQYIYLFVRFIDDMSIIVSDYEAGMTLMKVLNSRRDSINFTFRIRNLETQFLDLTLFKKFEKHEEQLAVKAYTKPMNKFLFLPPQSCHPKHIFNGWIIGYGKRIRLNCSEDTDFTTCRNDFQSRLAARGYSNEIINKALDTVPSRQVILDSAIQANSGRKLKDIGVPFVITYSPEILALLPFIKRALSLSNEAYLDPHFLQIFGHRTTPLLSFKRGSNLRDSIAPSALKTMPTPPTL